MLRSDQIRIRSGEHLRGVPRLLPLIDSGSSETSPSTTVADISNPVTDTTPVPDTTTAHRPGMSSTATVTTIPDTVGPSVASPATTSTSGTIASTSTAPGPVTTSPGVVTTGSVTPQLTVVSDPSDSPIVTVNRINGSTSVNGSPIAFPLTTNVQVNSIGGVCGNLPGDAPRVNLTISGPNVLLGRNGTADCVAGAWVFAVSPPFRNSPAGIDDGPYTITVSQAGSASTVGTTGPLEVTMATRTVSVTGNATTSLRPGGLSDLDLTITNPYAFDLRIEAINVTFLGSASCDGPSNFAVHRAFAGPLTVPSGTTALPPNLAPQIKMLNLPGVQDDCKLASITLNYSGLASRA